MKQKKKRKKKSENKIGSPVSARWKCCTYRVGRLEIELKALVARSRLPLGPRPTAFPLLNHVMAESLPVVTFPTILEFRGAELSGYRWLTNSISHFIKFISAISEVQSRYGGWTVSFHSRMIGQGKNHERSLFANRYDANKTAIATNERHYPIGSQSIPVPPRDAPPRWLGNPSSTFLFAWDLKIEGWDDSPAIGSCYLEIDELCFGIMLLEQFLPSRIRPHPRRRFPFTPSMARFFVKLGKNFEKLQTNCKWPRLLATSLQISKRLGHGRTAR